jgi:hypothetical protein
MDAFEKFIENICKCLKAVFRLFTELTHEVEQLLVRLFVVAGTVFAIWQLLSKHF